MGPSKIPKTGNKLWTNEERMLLEKVYYLNKSTTKHIIAGYDADTYQPMVKICDRATGTHITVTRSNFGSFIQLIESLLSDSYTVENGVVKRPGDISGLDVKPLAGKVWKLTHTTVIGSSVILHETSLRTLMRIEPLVQAYLSHHDPTVIESELKELAQATADVPIEGVIEQLYAQTVILDGSSLRYELAVNLLCNIESYMRLPKYSEGFYNRRA